MTRDEIWLEAVAKSKTETMPEHYTGYKAGYFDAALSREAEIATLRARVVELEGREILWRELEGYVGASYLDHGEYRRVCEIQKLLAPPIPLPEVK